MDEEISDENTDDVTLKLEVRDLDSCSIPHCRRSPQKDSEHCLFHMSEKLKNDKGEWESCSEQLLKEFQAVYPEGCQSDGNGS